MRLRGSGRMIWGPNGLAKEKESNEGGDEEMRWLRRDGGEIFWRGMLGRDERDFWGGMKEIFEEG